LSFSRALQPDCACLCVNSGGNYAGLNGIGFVDDDRIGSNLSGLGLKRFSRVPESQDLEFAGIVVRNDSNHFEGLLDLVVGSANCDLFIRSQGLVG